MLFSRIRLLKFLTFTTVLLFIATIYAVLNGNPVSNYLMERRTMDYLLHQGYKKGKSLKSRLAIIRNATQIESKVQLLM